MVRSNFQCPVHSGAHISDAGARSVCLGLELVSFSGMYRAERRRSWFLSISIAEEGEDATIWSRDPNLREIKGPWILAKWVMLIWPCLLIWGRLPTIGHGFGPGGVLTDREVNCFRTKKIRSRRRNRNRREGTEK